MPILTGNTASFCVLTGKPFSSSFPPPKGSVAFPSIPSCLSPPCCSPSLLTSPSHCVLPHLHVPVPKGSFSPPSHHCLLQVAPTTPVPPPAVTSPLFALRLSPSHFWEQQTCCSSKKCCLSLQETNGLLITSLMRLFLRQPGSLQLVVSKPISMQSSMSLYRRSSGGDPWIYLLCALLQSSPAHMPPPHQHRHHGTVTPAFHPRPQTTAPSQKQHESLLRGWVRQLLRVNK